MAEPVRHEGVADLLLEGALGAALDEGEARQEVGHRVVHGFLQMHVGRSRPYLGRKPLLLFVERLHQRVELVARRGAVGAGDVRVVAVRTGAGVDQKAARRRRSRPVVVLVMQHAGVLVQRDDVRIRQLALLLGTGGQVRHVDVELAAAAVERVPGGKVAAHSGAGGLDDARQLEGRLRGPGEGQLVDHRRRIDGLRSQVQVQRRSGPDQRGLAQLRQRLRQGGMQLVQRAVRLDLESVFRPVRQRRRQVPVVRQPMEVELRLLARAQ